MAKASGVRQKPEVSSKDSAALHQLTVRIPLALERRLEAYSVVTGRSYRNLAEAAIGDYLDRIRLSDEDRRKVRALVGD